MRILSDENKFYAAIIVPVFIITFFITFHIIRVHGTLWANYPVDKTGFGKNLASRDWYKGVSKKWRPYISSLDRLIVLEKGLAVAIALPVFDGKGNIIGILGGVQRTVFLAAFIDSRSRAHDVQRGKRTDGELQPWVNSYIVKPVGFEEFANAIQEMKRYWLLVNRLPVKSIS